MARFTMQRNVTEYFHGQCNISMLWGYLQCIEKEIMFCWNLLKTCALDHFTLPFLFSRFLRFHCRACAPWPLFGQVGANAIARTVCTRQRRLPNLLFTHVETLLGAEEFQQLPESSITRASSRNGNKE